MKENGAKLKRPEKGKRGKAIREGREKKGRGK